MSKKANLIQQAWDVWSESEPSDLIALRIVIDEALDFSLAQEQEQLYEPVYGDAVPLEEIQAQTHELYCKRRAIEMLLFYHIAVLKGKFDKVPSHNALKAGKGVMRGKPLTSENFQRLEALVNCYDPELRFKEWSAKAGVTEYQRIELRKSIERKRSVVFPRQNVKAFYTVIKHVFEVEKELSPFSKLAGKNWDNERKLET